MPDVPKIVQHRLRAAVPEETHPEADVLTAFAEQALPTSERDGVLQHLALCADCRDVIALALPPMETTIRPVDAEEKEAVVASAVGGYASAASTRQDRKPGFRWAGLAWANLRWAALAAGIAVAVLVMRPVLEHSGKTNEPKISAVSKPAPAMNPVGALEVVNGALPKGPRSQRVRPALLIPRKSAP